MTPRADILRAEISDIYEIAKMEEKYLPGGWKEKDFLDWIKLDNRVLLKAVLDNEIIGFANVSWVADEGELLNIAVEERFRHQGFAALLLEQLFCVFAENGIKSVFLEVREKNTGAMRFYDKYGFRKVGIRRNYYHDPDDDAVIMKKIL